MATLIVFALFIIGCLRLIYPTPVAPPPVSAAEQAARQRKAFVSQGPFLRELARFPHLCANETMLREAQDYVAAYPVPPADEPPVPPSPKNYC